MYYGSKVISIVENVEAFTTKLLREIIDITIEKTRRKNTTLEHTPLDVNSVIWRDGGRRMDILVE